MNECHMRHVCLAAIAGTSILVPFHTCQVTATHLKIGHPQLNDLQIGWTDLNN